MLQIPRSDAGGYKEVLSIATPLILSTASLTLMLFVDRMFLAWYSQAAVAASTPGGITYFTICSLFAGTAQYVNTLVAQHHGAGDKPACARAVWQGVWFSLISAPLILGCIGLGNAIFTWSGHAPAVSELEKQFFSILMVGGTALPLNASLSSFFSGRGKTMVVLWGNLAGNVANAFLDYCLIFGNFGFPEMGIRGAGYATALTGAIPIIYWGYLFLSRQYQEEYKTRAGCVLDKRLFVLLVRYGVPAGFQFFLDVSAFTVFVFLVGRLGEADLAATNIVLSIEMLSFLPMVGMSIATATLVGEYIGRNQPSVAEKSVRSALKLALAYTAILAVLYMITPDVFLSVFKSREHPDADFGLIAAKGMILLRLVAVYTLFDTMFIIYSGALKGAGDTQFAMWAQVFMAWIVFVPPVFFIIEYWHKGLYAAWVWLMVYAILLGVVFWWRFKSGYWKRLRMVEQPVES
jgi:MATE family multidrug resistance protein